MEAWLQCKAYFCCTFSSALYWAKTEKREYWSPLLLYIQKSKSISKWTITSKTDFSFWFIKYSTSTRMKKSKVHFADSFCKVDSLFVIERLIQLQFLMKKFWFLKTCIHSSRVVILSFNFKLELIKVQREDERSFWPCFVPCACGVIY